MATQFQTCKSETTIPPESSALLESAIRSKSKNLCVQRAWQRGMATAEYAVGILAAVALALVLLGIFNDSKFISEMLKFVTGLIGKISAALP